MIQDYFMKPQVRFVEFANSNFGFWICFWGEVGGTGGDDADTVT